LRNWPDTDDFPHLYENETRELLEGSPFLEKVDRVNEKYDEDYHYMVEKMPDFGRFTFEQFRSSMLLVSSRNFGVKVNGTSTNVMVPLCDMLNHASPYQASWSYNDGRDGFLMKAKMDIKKDEEIFDSYGGKSSYNFLLHYAFIF